MPRFLIQTDKETSCAERAAFYMFQEPFERATLTGITSVQPNPVLCPVGSVEFVRSWITHLGLKEPSPVDYPRQLWQYLGRDLFLCRDIRLVPRTLFPVFVKPVKTKKWTGFILPGWPMRTQAEPDISGPVWVSDVVGFREEFRVYVLAGQILFASRYDEFDDGSEEPSSAVLDMAGRMISDLNSHVFESRPGQYRIGISVSERLSAYALDIGITIDGRILLVELTDAWAAGLYKPAPNRYPNYRKGYFEWLYSRWQQIAANPSGVSTVAGTEAGATL